MTETIFVAFPPEMLQVIRELYELHCWPAPSPDYDVWTFEELCALFFRLERSEHCYLKLLSFVRTAIYGYMDDEFA